MIPILEALSRVEDVRPYLNMIVKENRVLFTKAAQVLRGGKVTERSNSQQPSQPDPKFPHSTNTSPKEESTRIKSGKKTGSIG